MITKYHVFPNEDADTCGGGALITVETADYNLDSLAIAKAVCKLIEEFHHIKDEEGKMFKGLAMQKTLYVNREKPMGEKELPRLINWV